MYHVNHFRKIYEARSAAIAAAAAIALPLSRMPSWWVFSLVCLALVVYRGSQTYRALAFRIAISTKWLSKIRVEVLLETRTAMKQSLDSMYLGTGFEWTQKHTQIAHDVLRMPSTEIPHLPKWIGAAATTKIEQFFAPANSIPDPMPQGSSWIHGMEPKKTRVPLHYKALGGHTAVGGTTGAGKTLTYNVISTQVIHDPNSILIIVDPKNDRGWMERVKRECERAGRKFLYFKQSAPSESIRLNPLESWSQPSEIPSRVAQLMEEGPFRDFAFLFIDRAVKGELFVGDKPNLRSILKYAQGGVGALLERCLRKFFPASGMANWEEEKQTFLNKEAQRGGATVLDAMVSLYSARFAAVDRGNEVIDGLVATHTHDRDHYTRVIASVMPLLQMLATGETGLMLAPKADDFDDDREIWDIDKVIRQRAVLYVGTDSMSNAMVAKSINSMLLSDVAAVAGAIYNFYDKPPEVVLIIDEVAEAINEQVIQILNKGRGAGFRAFVAFQTRSDLEAKLGNAAKMMQVLGNLNNQIVLRLEDTDTAQWFSDKAGETAIRNLITSTSTSTATESHAMEFGGTVSRSMQLEKVPLIPVELIQKLPNLQYFMRVSGGSVWQGRIPIIEG
ncbi:conjugal transfer pilus assembly protein TraD (plasmid) [Pararobbsia alpina]|uniref:conjugative transfer system coupling protein TraD n=1 Tax=Pararobbsia alpina TaxID=621374 RepID=UPI0039A482F7